MACIIKRTLVFIFFLFTFSFYSFAYHIVGGDITVRWVSGNNFEITLQFFRDCNTNVAFDDLILLGLYDKNTNAEDNIISMSNPVITKVILGDACYIPTTCIEKAVYKKIFSIANNTNGYYISYHRCCRNSGITNITAPDFAGYVMYCEIPNPALHNSSPTFNSVPDGYMCLNYPNTDNFTCTDADGDQLVYSFSTPLSCSATPICSANDPDPGASPKPYGTITWESGYSLANQMGDPAMAVDPATGIVTTVPPNNGLYVFCVKVEEYRAGVKIGEIQRDFQFQILGCSILNVAYTPAPEICSGNSTTLTANGASSAFTYLWNPGGQTTSAIAVSYTASGTYNYTVTATNGLCISKANATIIVNENPTQSYVTPNHILCNGGAGSAVVTPLGGSSPYLYSWSNGQTADIATNLFPGTYSVTVRDSNNCVSTETVTITEPAAVTLNTSTSGFSCAGSSPDGVVTATAGGGTPGYSYLWKPGNKTSPSVSNLIAGTYSVTVTDSKGCSLSHTATIVSSPKPDAKFRSEPVISCQGVTMKFTDESSPAPISSWNWNFGDGSTSFLQHPNHNFPYNAGTYSVVLIVSTPPCYDTVKTNIKITDMFSYASFEAANVFSPNGDGVNDCFIPALIGKGADTLKECVSLEVFDRWGVKMFESVGADNCWNGNNRNDSRPAVDGVYFYVSTLGKTTLKGYVTLVRNKPE